MWNILDSQERHCIHFYFPLQGKTVKTTIFRSNWQRFLNYGHLTGRFAQTLGRQGFNVIKLWSEITSGHDGLNHFISTYVSSTIC